MTKPNELESDLLFERSKLLIMATLARLEGEMSFNELTEATALTKGNLSSHLRKLEDIKFILIKKRFVDRKPLTTVTITGLGRAGLKSHLGRLELIIKGLKK